VRLPATRIVAVLCPLSERQASIQSPSSLIPNLDQFSFCDWAESLLKTFSRKHVTDKFIKEVKRLIIALAFNLQAQKI
jgi:hypothetical protein